MRFLAHCSLHRLGLSLLLTVGAITWDQWDQQSHLSWSQLSRATLAQAIVPASGVPASGVPASGTKKLTRSELAEVTSADQALLDAVASGRLGEAKAALEQGANPNAGDLYSGYALTSAATLGYKEIVQLLLERGATVDIAADEGYRPLIEAIAANQTPIVQILLEHGADPNRLAAGLTPLEFAIQRNNPEAVKLLLQAGATAKPANGHNLLAVAQQQGNAQIIELIRQAQR
jgi:hypothetical protein